MLHETLPAAEESLSVHSELCRVLADTHRLRLVLLLARGERNVSSLCRELHLSQPRVSKYLAMLRRNHLAVTRRQGKEIFYSLTARVTAGMLTIDLPPCRLTLGGLDDGLSPQAQD